jgi:hypothetical protein
MHATLIIYRDDRGYTWKVESPALGTPLTSSRFYDNRTDAVFFGAKTAKAHGLILASIENVKGFCTCV